MWDVFISHASEDKESIARPLAEELIKRGVKVWYDDLTLTVGDSLRRSIDEGLAKSKFGIVILSRAFFSKEWPQTELDGLAARQSMGHKVILPVWHEVTKQEVLQFSPTLADRLSANTAKGIESVVDQLLDVLAPNKRTQPIKLPTLRFLDNLWLDPVSIKILMNSLASGSEIVHIDWPHSAQILIEAVGSLAAELEDYHEPTSKFHNSSSDWVAEAYQMANGFYNYAKQMHRNISMRIPLLWKGMNGYWGNIANRGFEEALRNYIALSALTVELKLALYVNANFPEKRNVIPPHLSNWLNIKWAHPRQVFGCLFQKDEPTYAAEIHQVSNIYFNHYIYGPKSKVLQAYFDFGFPRRPIINGWFVQHLIPQIELILTEGWNERDCFVEYREEARINKIRDERDEEVTDDPRPIKTRRT